MLRNFFNPHFSAAATHITGTTFKLLQLEPSGSKVHVQSYIAAPLPKDSVVNDAIVKVNEVSAAIAAAIAKPTYGRLTTKRVGVTIPESKSFVRVIQIPKMKEAELDSAVLFEAESYVPLPIDQVYIDWKILNENEQGLQVLLAAAPVETVDSYVDVLEKAGLQVVDVEVESISISRALVLHGATETSLIVDIDSTKTNLIMFENGGIQFSSAVPIAGNTFTDAIAQALGVTKPQAEAIKRKTGVSNTPEYPNIRTILLPILKNLAEEIKNVIKFHQGHSTELTKRIILSGGNAKDKSLADFLSEELKSVGNISVELGSPWQNLPNLLKPVPFDDVEALRFSAAIGLAERLLD